MQDLSKRTVLLAFVFEGLLFVVALLWIKLRNFTVNFEFNSTIFGLAILATLPLLILNYLLFRHTSALPSSPYKKFLTVYIYPFCKAQTVGSAFIVSVMAGIAEELFFRAALQGEALIWFNFWLALLLVNFIFAYVHFIGMVAEYWRLLLFYCLFGCYFSFLVLFYDSILLAVITHAIYNFTVILMIKWSLQSTK